MLFRSEVTKAFIDSKIPFFHIDECSFQRKFIIEEHRSTRVADLLLKVWNIVQQNNGEISIVDISDKRIKVSVFKDEFNNIEYGDE